MWKDVFDLIKVKRLENTASLKEKDYLTGNVKFWSLYRFCPFRLNLLLSLLSAAILTNILTALQKWVGLLSFGLSQPLYQHQCTTQVPTLGFKCLQIFRRIIKTSLLHRTVLRWSFILHLNGPRMVRFLRNRPFVPKTKSSLKIMKRLNF